MRSVLTRFAAAVLLGLFATTASASPFHDELLARYDATDELDLYHAFDAVPTHGLWLRPLRDVLGVGGDDRFAIGDEPGHFVRNLTDDTAFMQLVGTNGGGQSVSITLDLALRGIGPAGEGTDGPQFQDGPPPTSITDAWAYYDLIDGFLTLDGFAGFEPGTTIAIDTYPNPNDSKPFQFGVFANWLDGDLGASMWFECPGTIDGHCGDVNVDLVPTVIPEPGTALLVGLGCALLSGTTRRGRSV